MGSTGTELKNLWNSSEECEYLKNEQKGGREKRKKRKKEKKEQEKKRITRKVWQTLGATEEISH